MNKFFLLLAVGLVNLFSVSADPLSLPLKKLDQYIQRQVEQEKVMGCAVAVVSNGKVVFLKAYGVRKKGEKEPVTPDTIFQLGSLSKTITASLIALLQKEGRMSLQDSVREYCPYLLPATQIQHLLNHTSGYSRAGWNQKIEAGQTRDQLLQLLAKRTQDTPGETYDYHNVVYSLLQEVVEKRCQQSFKEALRQRLFHPLKMTRTSVGYDDFEGQQNRAWPHQENKKHRWYSSKKYSHFYHDSVCASAGINSNIKDMVTFLQLQMGAIPDILTSQDLAAFHAPSTLAPDAKLWLQRVVPGDIQSHYGYGWRIIDYQHGRLVFHGGWLKGFMNFMGFIPSHNIGIVVLNNAESNFSLKTALMFFDWYVKNKKLPS